MSRHDRMQRFTAPCVVLLLIGVVGFASTSATDSAPRAAAAPTSRASLDHHVRPARSTPGGSATTTTFWAVTAQGSLMRFVVDGATVSVTIQDACTYDQLHAGSVAVAGEHFELRVGVNNSQMKDLDTITGTLSPAVGDEPATITGELDVVESSPEVEGKQGSASSCSENGSFTAMPDATTPSSSSPLEIIAGTAGRPSCWVGYDPSEGANSSSCAGPARKMGFVNPVGLSVDASGDVIFTDAEDSSADPGGTADFGDFIENLTPSGAARRVPGADENGQLSNPTGIAEDRAGDIYVAESNNLADPDVNEIGGEIVKITPSGKDIPIAGDYIPCARPPECGDGGKPKQAHLTVPSGLILDSAGNLFVADSGDNEVREITAGGEIKRIAGTGARCPPGQTCGDGGPATNARLDLPTGLALNSAGDLYIANAGNLEVDEVTPTGTITRVAGDGRSCQAFLPIAGNCGQGGPATEASLMPEQDYTCVGVPGGNQAFDYSDLGYVPPIALAVDKAGNLYIADCDEVLQVRPSGTITRLFGGWPLPCAGETCPGDGGPASNTVVSGVQGLVIEGSTLVVGITAQNSDPDTDKVNYGFIATLRI